jgi:DNA-binding NtrC family response regulator
VREDGDRRSIDWQPGEDFQAAKKRLIDRFERTVVTQALVAHGGNISQAARSLGLHRQNLQQKLQELGISAEGYRAGSLARD